MIVIKKILEKFGETIINKYKYKTNRSFDIQYINFPITYACNAKCSMCDIWKIYRDTPAQMKQEMTVDEIKAFFESNKSHLTKLKSVGFTGGEPTIKRGFKDLIIYLRDEYPDVRVGLQTNGLHPKSQLKTIKELYDANPNLGLAVSLDGTGKVHEEVRGVKNAYERALETIRGAKEMGIDSITVGLTISKKNIEQIHEVADVCDELGCEFSCFPAEEGDYFDNSGNDSLTLSQEEKQTVADKLKRFDYHYYMDNVRLQILGKRKRELDCYSGRSSIVLDPYGDIKPCLILDRTFGNIKNKSLNEVMTSDHTKEILAETKACKQCFLQCEVGTSILSDFTDLYKWFFFHSRNRMGFLKTYITKYNKPMHKKM